MDLIIWNFVAMAKNIAKTDADAPSALAFD